MFYKEENGMNKRMHESKKECLAALSSIVHSDYLRDFAEVLSYAYLEEDCGAERIARKLDLNQLHFSAVLNREEDYEYAEYEYEQNLKEEEAI